jgi:hypothetical protein
MKIISPLMIVWLALVGLYGCEKKADRLASEDDAAVAEGSKDTAAEPDEMQGRDDPKKEIPSEAGESEKKD